jgi:hypothetical protein
MKPLTNAQKQLLAEAGLRWVLLRVARLVETKKITLKEAGTFMKALHACFSEGSNHAN